MSTPEKPDFSRPASPSCPLAGARAACDDAEAESKVRAVELLISNLLRIGVGTSVAVIVLGVILFFARHPEYRATGSDYRRLLGGSREFPHTVAEVLVGLLSMRGQALVMVGLFLLIATPVMRVAVSIVAFLHQSDRRFALIAAGVLALLVLSFVLGKVTH